MLRRAPEGGGFILEGRGRDIMPLEIGLDFNADNARWSVLGEASTAFMGDARKAILDILCQLGEAGPKEISERCDVSYASIRQLLGKMAEQGVVNKIGRGSYTPAHNAHSVHKASLNGGSL